MVPDMPDRLMLQTTNSFRCEKFSEGVVRRLARPSPIGRSGLILGARCGYAVIKVELTPAP